MRLQFDDVGSSDPRKRGDKTGVLMGIVLFLRYFCCFSKINTVLNSNTFPGLAGTRDSTILIPAYPTPLPFWVGRSPG